MKRFDDDVEFDDFSDDCGPMSDVVVVILCALCLVGMGLALWVTA